MIHKDLYGQKEEIESKKFLGYDNIPTETRQRVFFTFSENAFYGRTGAFSGKPITDDFHNLRYEISKYKGVPNISDILDNQKAINDLLLNSTINDFLRIIELYVFTRKNDKNRGNYERLNDTIEDINQIFQNDKIGYEIVDGKIQKISQPGFEPLIKENIETNDPKNIDSRVKYAISKFSRYNSSVEERKEAVRTLADVLEYLGKFGIKLENKDDSDLFKIINGFDIRHHNRTQQGDYDKDVWYEWMFYTSLASIHVLLKLNGEKFDLKITKTT